MIIILIKLINKKNFIKEFNKFEIECLNYKNKSEYVKKFRKVIDEINDLIYNFY